MFTLNSEPVAFEQVVSGQLAIFFHEPESALSAGAYQVSFSVSDKAGNPTSKAWFFEVRGLNFHSFQPKAGAFIKQIPSTVTFLSSQLLDPASIKVISNGQPLTAIYDDQARQVTVAFPFQEDGTYELRIFAKNSAGEEARTTYSFTVDRAPPVLLEQRPVQETTVSEQSPSIRVKLTDEIFLDENSLQLFLDGNQVEAEKTSSLDVESGLQIWTLGFTPQTLLNAGHHQIRIVAKDRASNTLDETWAFQVPSYTLVKRSPAADSFVKTTLPFMKATFSEPIDPALSQLVLDDASIETELSEDRLTLSGKAKEPLSDGKHILTVTATSLTGKTLESSWSFTVDTKAPRIVQKLPRPDKWMNAESIVIGSSFIADHDAGWSALANPLFESEESGVDAGSISLLFNGQTVDPSISAQPSATSALFTLSARPQEGSNEVTLFVQDKAGNTTLEKWTFIYTSQIDNEPPEITNTSIADGVSLSESPKQVTATISDAGVGVDPDTIEAFIRPRSPPTWDGRDEHGLLLPDEEYIFAVFANPLPDNSIIVERARPALILAREPVSFSPFDAQAARIEFTLVEDAWLSAHVRDENGDTVVELRRQRSFPAGAHAIEWDGRDLFGLPVEEGTYVIEIEALHPQSGGTAKDAALVRVNTVKLMVTGNTLSAHAPPGSLVEIFRNEELLETVSLPTTFFSYALPVPAQSEAYRVVFHFPDGKTVERNFIKTPPLSNLFGFTGETYNPATGELVTISYEVPEQSTVSVYIFSMDTGELVRELLLNQPRYAGAQRERWAGKDDFGQPLPDGEYLMMVVGTRTQETVAQTDILALHRVKLERGPVVSNVTLSLSDEKTVQIEFGTDVPASCTLLYGSTPAQLNDRTQSADLSRQHRQSISGLTSGQEVFFEMDCTGPTGGTSQSGIFQLVMPTILGAVPTLNRSALRYAQAPRSSALQEFLPQRSQRGAQTGGFSLLDMPYGGEELGQGCCGRPWWYGARVSKTRKRVSPEAGWGAKAATGCTWQLVGPGHALMLCQSNDCQDRATFSFRTPEGVLLARRDLNFACGRREKWNQLCLLDTQSPPQVSGFLEEFSEFVIGAMLVTAGIANLGTKPFKGVSAIAAGICIWSDCAEGGIQTEQSMTAPILHAALQVCFSGECSGKDGKADFRAEDFLRLGEAFCAQEASNVSVGVRVRGYTKVGEEVREDFYDKGGQVTAAAQLYQAVRVLGLGKEMLVPETSVPFRQLVFEKPKDISHLLTQRDDHWYLPATEVCPHLRAGKTLDINFTGTLAEAAIVQGAKVQVSFTDITAAEPPDEPLDDTFEIVDVTPDSSQGEEAASLSPLTVTALIQFPQGFSKPVFKLTLSDLPPPPPGEETAVEGDVSACVPGAKGDSVVVVCEPDTPPDLGATGPQTLTFTIGKHPFGRGDTIQARLRVACCDGKDEARQISKSWSFKIGEGAEEALEECPSTGKLKLQGCPVVTKIILCDPDAASCSEATAMAWERVVLRGEKLRVVAKATGGDTTKADQINLTVSTSVTKPGGVSILLTETGAATGTYFGQMTSGEVENLMPTKGSDGVNEFASADVTTATPDSSNYNDSAQFDADMAADGRQPRGQARDAGNELFGQPAASRSFYQAAGIEYLRVCTKDQGVCTRRMIQNQADFFYYSGHGHHEDGSIETDQGVRVTPDEIGEFWKDDLSVAIFAGCAVIDVLRSPKPGKLWATKGPKILLGYHDAAPFDASGGDADFTKKIIEKWHDNLTKGAVEAWREANVITGILGCAGVTTNASAIDRSKGPGNVIFGYWLDCGGAFCCDSWKTSNESQW